MEFPEQIQKASAVRTQSLIFIKYSHADDHSQKQSHDTFFIIGSADIVALKQQIAQNECRMIRHDHLSLIHILIDIGHAYANGWDLEQTMEALKNQIVAYHLHNNDGVHDSHQRIFHGTLDFPLFLSDYQRLTPNADLVLEYSPNVADDESGIQEDISWLLEQIRR